MNDNPTVHYLVAPSLVRRLNVWLTSQGFLLAAKDETNPHPTTWWVTTGRPGADPDVSVREAARLLYAGEDTIRHRVETGSVRSEQVTRIPISEVRRLEAEGGGPPGDLLPL